MAKNEEQFVLAFRRTGSVRINFDEYLRMSAENRDSLKVDSVYAFATYLITIRKQEMLRNGWYEDFLTKECQALVDSLDGVFFLWESKTKMWEFLTYQYKNSYVMQEVMKSLPEIKVEAFKAKSEEKPKLANEAVRNLPLLQPEMEDAKEDSASEKSEEKAIVSQLHIHQNPSPSPEIQQIQIACNQGGVLCQENEEELFESVETTFQKIDDVPVESDAKKFELHEKGGIFNQEIKEELIEGIKSEAVENPQVGIQSNPEKIEAFEESYFLDIEDDQKGEKSDVEMMKEAELKSCQSLPTSLEIQKLESLIPSKKFDLTYCRNMIGSLWYLNASSPNIVLILKIDDYFVGKSFFMPFDICLDDKKLLNCENVEELVRPENWNDKGASQNLYENGDVRIENVSCGMFFVMHEIGTNVFKELHILKDRGGAYVNESLCFKNSIEKVEIGDTHVFGYAERISCRKIFEFYVSKAANPVFKSFERIESCNFATEVKIFDPGILKWESENFKGIFEMLKCKKQGGVAVKFFEDINNCEFDKIFMKKEKCKIFDPGILKLETENVEGIFEMLKFKNQGGAAPETSKAVNGYEFVKICSKKEKRKTFDPGIVKSGRMKL